MTDPGERAEGSDPFDLAGRVAVVCGGYGVLRGAIASDLGRAGARVAVLSRHRAAAQEKADEIGEGLALEADVLDEEALRGAHDELLDHWRAADILVNAAGGNVERARNDDRSIFEVPASAFDEALRLNLHGSVLPSMVFGRVMAARGAGCIVNISSMAALRVLSGVMAYSAAKSVIENFTR